MTENRFKNGQYEDALQYTKDILNSSLCIEDIIDQNNLYNENYLNDDNTENN